MRRHRRRKRGGALGGLLLLTVGACMRRVTLAVCLVLEHLFVLKMLSHIQRATEVKQFVEVSLKPLHCRDPTLPPLTAIQTVSHFPVEGAHAHYALIVRTRHQGFCTLVHPIYFVQPSP